MAIHVKLFFFSFPFKYVLSAISGDNNEVGINKLQAAASEIKSLQLLAVGKNIGILFCIKAVILGEEKERRRISYLNF